MSTIKKLIEAIGVTAQLCGNELQPAALVIFAEDLEARYSLEQILPALSRCRREVRGRLTPVDVISRIDDGRPGPEQAWSNLPRDESVSLFWTAEMAEAWNAARDFINEDDVAARMAFREVYVEAVRRARDEGRPVQWTHCFGTSYQGRIEAIEDAVSRHLITPGRARELMPELEGRRLEALAAGQPVSAVAVAAALPARVLSLAEVLTDVSNRAERTIPEDAPCLMPPEEKLQRHRALIAAMSDVTTAVTSHPAPSTPARSGAVR